MKTLTKGDIGKWGEEEVVKLIPCPSCEKTLIRLANNSHLIDLRCISCNFRAQVKTCFNKPTKRIRGAGWNVMDHWLKAGNMVPAHFFVNKWKVGTKTHQEIRFYSFIPRAHLKKRLAVIKSANREHAMFDYVKLDEIPHFVVYRK
jgi:hypothetical protein